MNACNFTIGSFMAAIVIRSEMKWIIMRFKNDWKPNTIVFDCKTIMWQLFG